MGEQRAAEFKPQPHGQIGMRKSGVYYCTDCGQNINSPGCRPTFDSLLNDPAQQLDTEGVVIASVLSEQERDRLRGEEGMSEKHSADYDAAEDEAERRGCVPENMCWQECVEAALDYRTRDIPPVEHRLMSPPQPARCTCGWEPALGESVWRAFDKHLLDQSAEPKA